MRHAIRHRDATLNALAVMTGGLTIAACVGTGLLTALAADYTAQKARGIAETKAAGAVAGAPARTAHAVPKAVVVVPTPAPIPAPARTVTTATQGRSASPAAAPARVAAPAPAPVAAPAPVPSAAPAPAVAPVRSAAS